MILPEVNAEGRRIEMESLALLGEPFMRPLEISSGKRATNLPDYPVLHRLSGKMKVE
ncbi:hypothetical protein D3C76_1881200 [compost metagenome]